MGDEDYCDLCLGLGLIVLVITPFFKGAKRINSSFRFEICSGYPWKISGTHRAALHYNMEHNMEQTIEKVIQGT